MSASHDAESDESVRWSGDGVRRDDDEEEEDDHP